MQRAVFIQPKAEPFFAHDSFAPRVVIHGAGAALFDCFVAAGVWCGHGDSHFISGCIFLWCFTLCVVVHGIFLFIAHVLLLLFGNRLRRQVGILTGRYLTCGCGGGCFKPQTLAACLRPHLPLRQGVSYSLCFNC